MPAAGPDDGYGPGESRFVEEKRHFEKPIPISDLVFLDRERCILCDRCTRFAKEVAGDPLIQLHRAGATRRRSTPSPTSRSRPTSAATPCRSARSARSPPSRTGSRPGRGTSSRSESRARRARSAAASRSQSSRDQRAALPGRRHRPGQLGLAVRQGPLRLRGGRAATSACASPLRPRGRRAASRPRGRARSTPPADCDPRGDRPPAGPASVAVLGGARLTNEDAYAWAKLAKGVIGTDNVDAQLGDGLPPDARARAADRDHRRGVRGRHAARARARPQGRAARPLPPAARRASRSAGCASSSCHRRRPRSRHSPRHRCATGRASRPRSCASLLGPAAPPPEGVERGLARAIGERRRASSVVRRSPRPARRDRGRDRRCRRGPPRRPGSSPRCAAATCAARSTWAWRRACCRAGWRSTTGRAGSLRTGARCPPSPASTPTGILAAAADGRIGCLVLLGADPLSDFPDRGLAERRARRRRDA